MRTIVSLGVSLVFLVITSVTAFSQPSAGSDFYVIEKSHTPLWTHENDENYSGGVVQFPSTPAHGHVVFPDYLLFPYWLQYNRSSASYIGFDSFTYKYVPAGGVGPESNVAFVGLILIGSDDAQNAGASCPIVGKPVNVTNGNMWLEQTDYRLPGRGEIIEIGRFYNSIIQSSGMFGFGWSTKYDESIILYGDKMIRLNRPDGRAIYFGRGETTQPYTSYSPGVVGNIIQNANGTFTLTYKDGSIRNFNSGGRLTSLSDRNGNVTTLAYDPNGRLTSITDPANRTLTLTPNGNGFVAQIADSLGTVVDYEYYPSPNQSLLKTVTYADASKFKFEYVTRTIDGQVRTYLATVKDALDNIVETHDYDTQGRATTSEIQGGAEKYTFLYDQADTPGIHTKVTDALGRITKYYHFREFGTNMVWRTEGACSCGGAGSEVTVYEYDNRNSWLNLAKMTDALGRETTYKYDDNQNVTEETHNLYGTQKWTYNSLGQVLTYKDRIDSSGTNNTAVLTYDSNGNLRTYTDALGKVTTLEYPTTGNVGLPDSIKDARNNITKFKWFNSGLLDEIEDAYSKKTKFTYDSRGRTKTITNALNHMTTYNYFDDTQRKVETIYPNLDKITFKYDIRRTLESVTDERGKITNYEFDPQYRLKKVTDPLGHAKEFGYDLMSNMTSYKDPLGNITDYVPDDFNRLKEVIHPAATTGETRLKERFEYDKTGRIKKYFDTANRLTEYTYNDNTRTNTVKNAENEITTIKYNLRFQTVEVTDAINQTYMFSYDPLGRLLSQARAGGAMSFEYDEVGNRKKRTDYAGRVTHYTHDNLNRLTKISYGDPVEVGAPPNLQATYGYDDISRLVAATNEAGTVSFNYDNRNRIKNTADVFGRLIEYEYERTSTVNQKRLKFDGAMYAVYNFDDAERLANIVNSSDSATITFGYDNEDKITSRGYPNGVTSTYEYYNNDLLKRLRDVNTTATLFDRQYTYNTANQIGTITDLSGTKSFGYDQVDRLTGVTVNGTPTESYSYDDVGNRTSSHLSPTYGYQSGKFNQLASTATATYLFDSNGNMVRKAEGSNLWTYTWDFENRLTQAATRKQNVRYRYDTLGRRVERNLGYSKERTKFVHDGLDVLVDDEAGVLTKYLNGAGIDNKLRAQTGTTVNYFLADHLGSTNGLTDPSGVIGVQASYDSFGNPSANPGTRYRYTGREYDSFSGFYYYRARFYDGNLGRFVSEDPIGLVGGLNQFAYVGNSPIDNNDPYGLFPSQLWWKYHQRITVRALDGMANPEQIRIMAREQYDFDSETQNEAYAPMHAMSRPGQKPEDARREANIFVRTRICTARNLSRMGYDGEAMKYLSQAMHTVQDAASTAHYDFQSAWPDTLANTIRQLITPFGINRSGHYYREMYSPGANSVADTSTRKIWRSYTGEIPMPEDFFPDSFDSAGGPLNSTMRTGRTRGGGNCGC